MNTRKHKQQLLFTDKYQEVIPDTKVKHAQAGELIQVHLFPGDDNGQMYRKTALQDRPYKTRVLVERDHSRVHHLHDENNCTIYVEK